MNRTMTDTVEKPGRQTHRILTHAVVALAISLGWIAQASALPSNLSFENDFTDWQTRGNTSIQGTLGDISPTDGTKQALLTTYADDGKAGSIGSEGVGEGPVLPDELESFLGLPNGTLASNPDTSAPSLKGSAIFTTFSGVAGQLLTFNWHFLTTDGSADPSFADFAFVSLTSNSLLSPNLQILGSTLSPLTSSTAAFANNGCFMCPGDPISMRASGVYSFVLPATETYTLRLGVINVGEDATDSALVVDVPEPSTGFLLVAGLIGLVWWRRSQLASA